ncbi:phosphopantothenoylcysteine decarboxylase [Vagococcus elongatus]|uniref:Phosphopantothenoylcysteine decarboxylase n=1 Tax=Vagococcus elongatus TaxID=180344 RepID=A0A430AQJ4_9ENTE|nr:phosphopantothenoylcysteine decarboxylase [Vagococcus elongatus]RSU10326.1 phosphopantothenoylcysteine decarboxylase [Vagococcus elongatus]
MTNILLGVSGSISAYKAADITSQFAKKGWTVDVVMTKNSQEFITPLTLQSLSKKTVHSDLMIEHSPENITHIDLAKAADLFIIAPATANIIAKLANGLADDLLSAVALAFPNPNMPKLIAPAMNTYMYEHPIVQKNLLTLKEIGYEIIEPKESLLACGDFGKGALQDVELIVRRVEEEINKNNETYSVEYS